LPVALFQANTCPCRKRDVCAWFGRDRYQDRGSAGAPDHLETRHRSGACVNADGCSVEPAWSPNCREWTRRNR